MTNKTAINYNIFYFWEKLNFNSDFHPQKYMRRQGSQTFGPPNAFVRRNDVKIATENESTQFLVNSLLSSSLESLLEESLSSSSELLWLLELEDFSRCFLFLFFLALLLLGPGSTSERRSSPTGNGWESKTAPSDHRAFRTPPTTEFPSVVIVLLFYLGLRFSSGETHKQKVDAKDVITEKQNQILNLSFLKNRILFIV